MVSLRAVDDKVVISFVLNQSILDELTHQTVGHCARLGLLLELHNLLLQGMDFLVLRLIVELSLRCSRLFLSDLGLGAAPLAAGFQHVSRYAFRHYTEKELVRCEERRCTYRRREWMH